MLFRNVLASLLLTLTKYNPFLVSYFKIKLGVKTEKYSHLPYIKTATTELKKALKQSAVYLREALINREYLLIPGL